MRPVGYEVVVRMAQPDLNPYTAPQAIDAQEPDPRRVALDRLRGPSFGLLLLSAFWGGLGIVALVGLAILFAASLVPRWDFVSVGLFNARMMLGILSMLPSCFIAYGAWCMRRGARYRVVVAASILACVPPVSPLIFAGVPFGIWALIVLRRRDVREAFCSDSD